MHNRKALSDIVSTVLIILLVVAAIAIIGGIVLKLVGNAGPKVDTAVACMQINVQPVSCSDASWTFTRNVGGSEYALSKVTAFFKDDSGVSKGSETYTVTTELAKVPNTMTDTYVKPAGTTKMTVAATVKGSSESCSESAPITCT